jgi:hypothetical protein
LRSQRLVLTAPGAFWPAAARKKPVYFFDFGHKWPELKKRMSFSSLRSQET